jgi:hypothetical protein
MDIITEAHADLPGYEQTRCNALLDSVYGDHVHANDGTHMKGGFQDDGVWQQYWKRMVQITPRRYMVPKGKVGQRFLTILTNEFRSVRMRLSNSEKPLVFVAVILEKAPGVKSAKDIRARLTTRMDLWLQGSHKALVTDTENLALARIGAASPKTDEETRSRAYNERVLSGRLRSAVRNLTNREGGGGPGAKRQVH